mmetsp:Transcript_40207/g.116246  ORF Transcript_40207/g.116246 Transcript_40207/m.116246 type:complete len:314 (-) Transcript_40207:266-1207(-)
MAPKAPQERRRSAVVCRLAALSDGADLLHRGPGRKADAFPEVHIGTCALHDDDVWSNGAAQCRRDGLQKLAEGGAFPNRRDRRRPGVRPELQHHEEAEVGGRALQNLQEHCLHQGHVQLGLGGGQVLPREDPDRQRHPWGDQEGRRNERQLPRDLRGPHTHVGLGRLQDVGQGGAQEVLPPCRRRRAMAAGAAHRRAPRREGCRGARQQGQPVRQAAPAPREEVQQVEGPESVGRRAPLQAQVEARGLDGEGPFAQEGRRRYIAEGARDQPPSQQTVHGPERKVANTEGGVGEEEDCEGEAGALHSGEARSGE